MPTPPRKPSKPKPIKRGQFVRLPNGAGSIKIERNGSVVYKPAAKKPRKKNPSNRKTKKQLSRGRRKVAAWVRSQIKSKAR